MSAALVTFAETDSCRLCGLYGTHRHQPHLWSRVGKSRLMCGGCGVPRTDENRHDWCRALLLAPRDEVRVSKGA